MTIESKAKPVLLKILFVLLFLVLGYFAFREFLLGMMFMSEARLVKYASIISLFISYAIFLLVEKRFPNGKHKAFLGLLLFIASFSALFVWSGFNFKKKSASITAAYLKPLVWPVECAQKNLSYGGFMDHILEFDFQCPSSTDLTKVFGVPMDDKAKFQQKCFNVSPNEQNYFFTKNKQHVCMSYDPKSGLGEARMFDH